MKILIGFLLTLFISGHAYSNPYRSSDKNLNYGCIIIEELVKTWVNLHGDALPYKTKQTEAEEALEFAKEYSTIYKNLDCREVLRQE